MLPISPDVMYDELKGARAILDKWIKKLEDKQIPNIDMPGTDPNALAYFLNELVGELHVASNKCDSIAEIIERFGRE
jgi:hypothetical protein